MIPGLSHIPRSTVVAAAVLLSACAQPKLTGEESVNLSVRSVTVDTANMEQAVTGRPNAITREKLASDITSLVNQRVANRPGTTAAELTVEVKRVNLIARGASALAPLQSTSTAVLSVTEAGTGRVIVEPTEITAASAQLRFGGVIGAATAPTVDNDYLQTLNGLAIAIEKRLYGDPEE